MIDGHSIGLTKCPLSAVKRISQFHMFAYDPKRSLSTAYCGMLGKFGDDTQMVLHRIAHWSLVTTTIFAVTAAVAQTGGPGRGADGGKFRAACGDDLQRFCANVQPGGGRVVQCLSSHTPELSESCETMIADARGGTKLRAACGDDLKRFCADVRPGGAASFNVYRPMLVRCRQRVGIRSQRCMLAQEPPIKVCDTKLIVPFVVASNSNSIERQNCS
jgi:Cysteine rich repeat